MSTTADLASPWTGFNSCSRRATCWTARHEQGSSPAIAQEAVHTFLDALQKMLCHLVGSAYRRGEFSEVPRKTLNVLRVNAVERCADGNPLGDRAGLNETHHVLQGGGILIVLS